MAEFENPYAKHDPFIQADVECPDCGGKLWEYALQGQMVCEDCRALFPTDEMKAAVAGV